MRKFSAAVLGGLLAAAALAATAPLAAAPAKRAATVPWQAPLSRTADGAHVYGNPAARLRLIEYSSYTCPHCAHYAHDSQSQLFPGMVRQGQVAVEIRPFLRNIVDVSASLLAQCGAPGRFYGNHHAILAAQSNWLKTPTDAAQKRWGTLAFAARLKAVAQDMGLYRLMLGRGYTTAQLDQCLADRALADRLAASTNDAVNRLGVRGTPGFVLNDRLLEAHDWATLQPQLSAALR